MKPRSELTAREVEDLHLSLIQRMGDTSLPTLPQVAMEIINLIGDPDSTIKQFSQVISGDQALTGRLLRMANSAAFAQRGPVTKVERAMVLLGLERLKALALGFHLSKAMAENSSGLGFAAMWTQSLFRGCLAMKIAERINKSFSGEAFVCAFMADAGVPTMPELLTDRDYQGEMGSLNHPTKLHANERANYPFTHVDVAAALCRIWKMPEALSKPITRHHTRPESCDFTDGNSVRHAITYFCCNVPILPSGEVMEAKLTERDAQRLFEIGPADLKTILEETAADFNAFKSMFGDVIDPEISVDEILEEATNQLAEPEEEAEAGEETVFNACGMVLAITVASSGDSVRVNVTSEEGEPLVSEQFAPSEVSDDEIKSRLLIDEIEPELFTQLRASLAPAA